MAAPLSLWLDYMLWSRKSHNGEKVSVVEVQARPAGAATGGVDDDDCIYYHSWRNNVVIAFGTLSSFLT